MSAEIPRPAGSFTVSIGNSRQTFFCKLGGFDMHGNLLNQHRKKMKEVSNALLAFQNTLDALGVSDKVVTSEGADFSRTLTPNGKGFDHAWGVHQFVMGGPVQGQKLYGKYLDLTPGGPDDAGG